MLLKIAVLVGLAIYFFNAGEPGLSLMAAGAIIPGIGVVLAGTLMIILIVKTWYGSAVIVAGLVAFNLIGNALLDKKLIPPDENPPP